MFVCKLYGCWFVLSPVAVTYPKYPFVDIVKYETWAKLQQNILKSVVVGARQSFQFFRQLTCFLGNYRGLSKLLYGILHYLISIIRLEKTQSAQASFISTTRATWKVQLSLSWWRSLSYGNQFIDLQSKSHYFLKQIKQSLEEIFLD